MPAKTNVTPVATIEAVLPATTKGRESECVPHKVIIDKIRAELKKAGYTIDDEQYRASFNTLVVSGIFFLTQNGGNNPSITPIFTFMNSYEHPNEFCCSFGCFFPDTSCLSIPGTLARTPKKVKFRLAMAIQRIENEFKREAEVQLKLIQEQIQLVEADADKAFIARTVGSLFVESEALTLSQLGVLKKAINARKDTNMCAADVYAMVTECMSDSHPRVLLNNLSNLHEYFINNLSQVATPAPVVNTNHNPKPAVVNEEYVSPMPSVVFL